MENTRLRVQFAIDRVNGGYIVQTGNLHEGIMPCAAAIAGSADAVRQLCSEELERRLAVFLNTPVPPASLKETSPAKEW